MPESPYMQCFVVSPPNPNVGLCIVFCAGLLQQVLWGLFSCGVLKKETPELLAPQRFPVIGQKWALNPFDFLR